MAISISKLRITCKDCGVELLRLTGPGFDQIQCPTCTAEGEHDDVVEDGSGLARTGYTTSGVRDYIYQALSDMASRRTRSVTYI